MAAMPAKATVAVEVNMEAAFKSLGNGFRVMSVVLEQQAEGFRRAADAMDERAAREAIKNVEAEALKQFELEDPRGRDPGPAVDEAVRHFGDDLPPA